jgi:hypothetical protein
MGYVLLCSTYSIYSSYSTCVLPVPFFPHATTSMFCLFKVCVNPKFHLFCHCVLLVLPVFCLFCLFCLFQLFCHSNVPPTVFCLVYLCVLLVLLVLLVSLFQSSTHFVLLVPPLCSACISDCNSLFCLLNLCLSMFVLFVEQTHHSAQQPLQFEHNLFLEHSKKTHCLNVKSTSRK